MFVRRLIEACFPATCLGCGRGSQPFCAGCGPSPEHARDLDRGSLAVRAAGPYAGTLRRAVLAYKSGRRDVGEALAALLVEASRHPHQRDVFVPVPTTRRRRGDRGFDQGVLLARALGAAFDRPVLEVLRQSAGDAQRGRSRLARLGARDRFICVAPTIVAGARLVLVDDVVTTGATLADCAGALRACGAVVHRAIVIAYA